MTTDVVEKPTSMACDGSVEPLKCEEDSPQPGPETEASPAGHNGSEQPASSTIDIGPITETENSSSTRPSNTLEVLHAPVPNVDKAETPDTKEQDTGCNESQNGKPVKPQKRVTFDLTVQEPKSGVTDSVICLNTNMGWKWKIMEEMNRLEVALRRGENIRGEGSRIFKDDRGRIVLVTKRKVKTSK